MKTTDILMELKEAVARIEQKLDDNCKDTLDVKIQATRTNGKVAEQEKVLSEIISYKNDFLRTKQLTRENKERIDCMNSSFKTIKWLLGSGFSVTILLYLLQ